MKTKRSLLTLILSAFWVLSVYDMAFAGWRTDNNGYPGGHMMGSGYMGWFMILFWGLLLLALILLIRWIAQLPQPKETAQSSDRHPLDILKERLALGEIEIEEYREKKQLLSDQN